MSGVLFYTIGTAVAGGILFRSFFDFGSMGILQVLTIVLGLGLVWFIKKSDMSSPLFLLAFAMFCFSIGVMRFHVSESGSSPLSAEVGERVMYEGIIIREPEVRERSAHLYVALEEDEETILVTADRFETFAYGDRVSVAGALKEPEAFETDYGRIFDYPGYLKARGVSYTVPFAQVEVLGHGEGNIVIEYLLRGKRAFVSSLGKAITEPEASLGQGILLGVRRALGDEIEESFRVVGIIHIVVLSGYNVMIIAEAIMRMLSFVLRPYARMVVGILVIACFALIVGLSATVVRASIMAGLVLIARATGRRYAVMRALMLAGVVMILINPHLLAFDPGFQLSFIATLGLIALAPIIEARLIKVPTKFHLREVMTATFATQIFILPFLVYQIGTFSAVSFIVNLLVLPVVPFAMLFAFIAGVAGLISSTLGIIAGFPAYILLAYIIRLAETFATLPFASLVIPPIPFIIVVFVYALIGLGMLLIKRNGESELVSTIEGEKSDPYSDWIIEEVTEKPAAVRSTAAGPHDSFPFR